MKQSTEHRGEFETKEKKNPDFRINQVIKSKGKGKISSILDETIEAVRVRSRLRQREKKKTQKQIVTHDLEDEKQIRGPHCEQKGKKFEDSERGVAA